MANGWHPDIRRPIKPGSMGTERVVHFIDALPRTPSGNVQRFALRNRRRDEMASG